MKILNKDATKGELLYAAFLTITSTVCFGAFIFVRRDFEILLFGWLLVTNLAILQNRAMIRGLKAESAQTD